MAESRDYDFEAAGEDSHICDICQSMVKLAVEIEQCPHTFCQGCLKSWQNQPHSRQGDSFRCPSCNTLYQRCHVHRSKYLDRIIKSKVTVKCKRSKEGCPWLGTIDDYYKIHEKECIYRLVMCGLCSKQYSFSKLQGHKHECVGYVKCPNSGCNELIKQEEIPNHLRTLCLHEEIPCLHSVYGCRVVMKRRTMEKHQVNAWKHHFELFDSHHTSITKELTKEKDNYKKLKENNQTLAQHLAEAKVQIMQLENKLKQEEEEQEEQQQQQQQVTLRKKELGPSLPTTPFLPFLPSCLSNEELAQHWTFDVFENLLKTKDTNKFNAVIVLKPSLAKLCNDGKETLLHRAVVHGATECVEVLIRNGCDVKEKNNYGWMAIHCVACYNNTRMAEVLLTHDSTLINAITNYKLTPLHWAVQSNHREMVEFLLGQPSVDVNVKDRYGQTPLEYARHESIRKIINQFTVNWIYCRSIRFIVGQLDLYLRLTFMREGSSQTKVVFTTECGPQKLETRELKMHFRCFHDKSIYQTNWSHAQVPYYNTS